MARALRGEKLTSKDLEIIVERPDGGKRGSSGAESCDQRAGQNRWRD